MIQIMGDIGGLILEAQKTGSEEALAAKLEYLNRWGADAEYSIQVRGSIIDPKRKEMGITFLNRQGESLMHGGLVYHEHSNEWGVHS